jgi:putative ATP-dependent endonuclease of OLD family
MQLDHVGIEDFRGIDRLSTDVDELTTIIGEHDAGKSSLLRAIARVLDPRDIDQLPGFAAADFHRPGLDEAERATVLSITLGLRADDDDPLIPDDERLRNGLRDGGVSLHVVAQRGAETEPTTSVTVIDRSGSAIEGIDGPQLLVELRRRHPAVIVGGPRPNISRKHPDDSRLRSLLLGAAEPRAPLTWDELVDVREDLLRTAGALADQLGSTPERRRSVREMTDTPRPLTTDLGSALEEDAGPHRRIAALWLLVAILDALPADGIGAEAEPILLFDDIEANLHPTWLAALTSVALNLPFQEIVATHSPEVLAWVPLSSLRRLVRADGEIESRSVQPASYSTEELRRLTHHLRLNRGGSFFARCWVLVEGETEAWLVPEFARIAGVEFPVEGIRVIEFAQSGLTPLVKIADDLGIGWLLLADGDTAGKNYGRAALKLAKAGGGGGVIVLPDRDIEHYLFRNGYEDVIRKAAGRSRKRKASEVIRAAIEQSSKPGLALEILAAADGRGEDGVPPVIRDLATTARDLARA